MRYLVKIAYQFIIVLAVAGALLVSCSEKVPVTDAQTLMLKGKVRVIEEELFFANYSFDKIILDKILYKRYYLFDTSERFTEFLHANIFLSKPDMPANLPDTTLYNTPADTIATTVADSTLLSDSLQLAKQAKEWHTQQTENIEEPNYIRKEYKYLNDSVYIINCFNKRGYLINYDDCRILNSKLATISSYTEDDKLLSKTEYEYDKKGRLKTKTTYYEKLSYQTRYKYSMGRKYESYSYVANLSVFSYNRAGLVSKQKNYSGDTHTSTIRYKYDINGNPTKISEADKINNLKKETTYTYTYDKHSNWTERIEKCYDGNIFITRRTIDYY